MTGGPQLRITSAPVFIVGSPRSGTTITAWSLARHSQFWTSEESDILFDLLGWGHVHRAFGKARARPGGIDWLKVNNVEKSEFLGYLGLGFNALITSRSQGRRWVDQTPRNTLLIDVLVDMFPDARFLHILRDGRQVVDSMTHFPDMMTEELQREFVSTERMPAWATDFRAACREWAKFVETANHFAVRFPGRFHTVVTEQLVAAPLDGFRTIFHFLGVPNEDGPAEFFRTHRLNASFPQTSDGAARPNPWLGWSDEKRNVFLQEAGDTLIHCGLATEAEILPGEYHQSVFHLRSSVRTVVPLSSIALVVSGGDEVLLHLGGLNGWHFPRDKQGDHDQTPRGEEQMIAHLEELRGVGASYLIVPKSGLDWLDQLKIFRAYLDERYRWLVSDEQCLILSLAARSGSHPQPTPKAN